MYQLVQTQRDLLILINNPQPNIINHQLYLTLLQHEAETEVMIKNYLKILNFKVNLRQSKHTTTEEMINTNISILT